MLVVASTSSELVVLVVTIVRTSSHARYLSFESASCDTLTCDTIRDTIFVTSLYAATRRYDAMLRYQNISTTLPVRDVKYHRSSIVIARPIFINLRTVTYVPSTAVGNLYRSFVNIILTS